MGDHDVAERQALDAAEQWLTLVDAGDYGEAWEQAASLMKGAVTKDALTESLRQARGMFGALRSRAPSSKTYATSLPGAPDGEYVVIRMDAKFEHKLAAVETVTPMRQPDGAWRVSGYFIA